MRLIQSGNPRMPIWLCGEAPGEEEVARGIPFTGASGQELTRMLSEAGLERSSMFCTNICHERPPSYVKNGKTVNNDIDQWFAGPVKGRQLGWPSRDKVFYHPAIAAGIEHLLALARTYRPVLVIALGNTPLWALCDVDGITKWRGSELWSDAAECKVLPTFHPADVLRAWTHRPIVIQDFRRARRESAYREVIIPTWEFTVEPTLADIKDWFDTYCRDPATPLVSDTEGWGRVDCIGFATNSHAALCVPFARETDPEHPHYWQSAEDELAAALACQDILRRHPTTFHNAVWDCQVIAQSLGFLPRLADDTQVAQHVAFPGLLGGRIDPTTGKVDKKGSSLSLSFVASMYCDHYRFWKDDGRTFDPSIGDERDFWRYNCEDCVRTFECRDALIGPGGVIDNFRLRDQYQFTMSLYGPVLKMMFTGFRYDAAEARQQRAWYGRIVRKAGTVIERREGALTRVQDWLNEAVGCDFNPDSAPQMKALFYDDLGVRKRFNRNTKALTLDDAALDGIKREMPLLYPLITQIQNYRTLDTLRAALKMKLSSDGRLRCAINPAFVETMRFSTNETAFGEGSNLQNIKRPDND